MRLRFLTETTYACQHRSTGRTPQTQIQKILRFFFPTEGLYLWIYNARCIDLSITKERRRTGIVIAGQMGDPQQSKGK
jgi:hypothetical protein